MPVSYSETEFFWQCAHRAIVMRVTWLWLVSELQSAVLICQATLKNVVILNSNPWRWEILQLAFWCSFLSDTCFYPRWHCKNVCETSSWDCWCIPKSTWWQGHRQRGEGCPPPHLKSVTPISCLARGFCIHPLLYFKNVAPLVVFGPPCCEILAMGLVGGFTKNWYEPILVVLQVYALLD